MPTNFDFNLIQTDVIHEWAHRGRYAVPIPEQLVKALHESREHASTAAIPVPMDRMNSFKNILNKAGRELNYRIHKEIVEDSPREGLATFYFKVVGRRKPAQS